MIISFAGHGDLIITKELRELLKKAITESMDDETVFYLGGYGNFDMLCASVVKELKGSFPKIRAVFVTPYLDSSRLKEAEASGLYDNTLYPDLENVPKRFAISKRNEYVIECSDIVICYVSRSFGGAYKSLMFAKRKGKKIVNLCGLEKN